MLFLPLLYDDKIRIIALGMKKYKVIIMFCFAKITLEYQNDG